METGTHDLIPVQATVLLAQVSALLARAAGRALGRWRVSWPQALSLVVLADCQTPISATRLVEQLGLGRTAMTSVVDRLERNGWVERRPSAVDRRTADLVLTNEGRLLVDQVRPVLRELASATFAGFRPRDLERLTADLSRVRGDLVAHLYRSSAAAGSPSLTQHGAGRQLP